MLHKLCKCYESVCIKERKTEPRTGTILCQQDTDLKGRTLGRPTMLHRRNHDLGGTSKQLITNNCKVKLVMNMWQRKYTLRVKC